MKIAIASSGLGFIRRGVESWAENLAEKLHDRGDTDVVLFHGGANVRCPNVTRSYLNRGRQSNRFLSSIAPAFTWRWGWNSAYGIEQFTFWRVLRKELRRGSFDILHTQDALLAKLCNDDAGRGYWSGKVILAHGTEESAEFLSQFEYVQHLTPWHMEQFENQTIDHRLWTIDYSGGAKSQTTQQPGSKHLHVSGRLNFAIPNFVDTQLFRPAENRLASKRALGMPEDAIVVGCVAAIKKAHKRIDCLIREFADSVKARALEGKQPLFLLVAGASTSDTDELKEMAEYLVPKRVKFMCDLSHRGMPAIYNSMDMFVLPSLFEMMPIALIEAMSSGLPVAVNNHPNLVWIAGEGGVFFDMSQAGVMQTILASDHAALGQAARNRALNVFAEGIVLPQIVSMYNKVALQ